MSWPNLHTGTGVVAVDFDGVIYPNTSLYHMGATPLSGATTFLDDLRAKGYRIVIHTTRCSRTSISPGDVKRERKWVRDWLNKWELPFDLITADKVPAEVYIDDRAISAVPNNPEGAFEDFWALMARKKRIDSWFDDHSHGEFAIQATPPEHKEAPMTDPRPDPESYRLAAIRALEQADDIEDQNRYMAEYYVARAAVLADLYSTADYRAIAEEEWRQNHLTASVEDTLSEDDTSHNPWYGQPHPPTIWQPLAPASDDEVEVEADIRMSFEEPVRPSEADALTYAALRDALRDMAAQPAGGGSPVEVCPVCGDGIMARLADGWPVFWKDSKPIPVIGCGNPWHYATQSLGDTPGPDDEHSAWFREGWQSRDRNEPLVENTKAHSNVITEQEG